MLGFLRRLSFVVGIIPAVLLWLTCTFAFLAGGYVIVWIIGGVDLVAKLDSKIGNPFGLAERGIKKWLGIEG